MDTNCNNGVYAYNVIGDFRIEENLTTIRYTIRYTLATNFSVIDRVATTSRFRPGPLTVVQSKANKKPLFLVDTDGGGQLVLLSPKNNNPNDWTYNNNTLAQFGCDILDPIIHDLDNNGKLDISVPCLSGTSILNFKTTINY